MESYLTSVKKQFLYYKSLGDKTFNQLTEKDFFKKQNDSDNSIAIIVKHLTGNMLSRWTNFFEEDGEKNWRNRDDEFTSTYLTKVEVIINWEKGWDCLFKTINSLENKDLNKIVYIRNQGHTVIEAINRQLCHYSYHVGQIVLKAKDLNSDTWISLSIPKNNSKSYNSKKFKQSKSRKNFIDSK